MSGRIVGLALNPTAPDYFARSGVFELPCVRGTAMYESALGLNVSAAVQKYVEQLRDDLAWPVPADHVLRPHVTVLFLGRMPGQRLLQLYAVLSELSWSALSAVIVGIDVFRSGDGVVNLHLRVDCPDLRELHTRAYEHCVGAGWTPQTPFVLDRYVAHISIFDGLDPATVHAVPRVPFPETVALDELHLMAKLIR